MTSAYTLYQCLCIIRNASASGFAAKGGGFLFPYPIDPIGPVASSL